MTAVPANVLQGQPVPSSLIASKVPRSNATPRGGEAGPDPRLHEAAKQFEAVFIRQMLSSLEKTTSAPGGSPATGGSIYGSMVVNTVADAIANAGGLGLANLLTSSLQSAPQGLPHATSTAGAVDATASRGAGPVQPSPAAGAPAPSFGVSREVRHR